MSPVFLDAVGLLATWDRNDQWHDAAEKVYSDLMSRREQLITSTFVLLECGNAAARRPYRADVDDLRVLLDSLGLLVTPSDSDWEKAWRAYRMGRAGTAGIVDHVSFVIMRRLGLTRAFTNDRHFRDAGFTTLF